MKRCLLVAFFCCFFPIQLQAKAVVFQESYTYDASEADSKLTCRAISLLEVKKLLLERIGTYLETETQVVNYQLTKDQITMFTAGVVKTNIIEETWNGKSYTLVAKIEADPDAIANAIDDLRNSRQKKDQLFRIETVNEQAVEKIKSLKKEMALLQNNLIDINRDYSESTKIIDAWESFENGSQFLVDGEYEKAVEAFSQSIELNPTYMHYVNRGKAYKGMKEYRKAIADFSTALELNPKLKNVYFMRGQAYRKSGVRKKAMRDIKKAAQLGSKQAKQWLEIRNSRLF